MKYYHLKSILAAGKQSFSLATTSSSFSVTAQQSRAYIEPEFKKVEYNTEKPTVILVSAVGASGKTALAEQLSFDTSLPLLDLSKHKPVGDNTLTGLLTHSFDVGDIGGVLAGLAQGGYGVIIDGVDEGRSKTTEKAFEAFLDDIAKLCHRNSGTTFIMLGRTQILDDCWLYLTEKDISTALITISPFSVSQAREYIDTYTGIGDSSPQQYRRVRDEIIDKLGRAFIGGASEGEEDFLSFIGYPPVLDSIVTLLKEEKNYFKLLENLGGIEGNNVEVMLLLRIARYILTREREMKVIPNIVRPLLEDVPEPLKGRALENVFSLNEQCVRLVAYCLGRQLSLSSIGEPVLDEQYEARISEWTDHPFLSGRQFRNAVFEALALATLVAAGGEDNYSLVTEYLSGHKHSYHFVYMLDTVLKDGRLPVSMLDPLFTAAMEFKSEYSSVEIRVDGPDWSEGTYGELSATEIEVEVGLVLGAERRETQTFTFHSDVTPESVIALGSRLSGAFITVPCSVQLRAAYELEFMAPLEISARHIELEARELILRAHKTDAPEVLIESGSLKSSAEKITTNGVSLVFAVADSSGIAYPAIQYVQRTSQPPADPLLRQKYFRLRRILMEFRSHSKGALAKYKYKIEAERVLKNEVGESVLNKLVYDGILSLRGNMYYLDPDRLSSHIGISWQNLRKGQMPSSLLKYLASIS